MKGYLKSVIPLGLAVSVILLGGMAMLSYRSIVDQVETADWVTHTHIVLERLETLRAGLVKAQSARRGFVLTDEVNFAEEFSAARAAIQKAAGELRTLTADNASQQKRLDEIEPLLAERIRLLEQSNEGVQFNNLSLREQIGRIWVEAEIDKGATFYFTLEGLEGARAVSAGIAHVPGVLS